ncbi:MAG TPA: hypothetical protein RMH26_27180, partial [Polyangiaceae bacterium LLY-WYZ-15_(1-7)]|nr:hypothetical protein [Polyangiaceae bacterium LLY-WYZ-15_(1-7)]
DGNGALGDGEVTSTRYVCDGANGADGEDGTPSLIATADEPAGMNCEFGGVVITSGLDADGSGTLEPAEVSSTQYVCDGAGGAGVVLDFPSEDSSLDNTFTVEPLGAGGGGAAYVAGSSVSESFTDTGLPSVTGLTYEFEMDDSTNSSCPVGTLSFDIVLNGVTVDSYSFEGGSDMGTIGFSGGAIFPAIDGGATGDYDLEIVANETVCGGGGSYNWFAGGAFVLRP